MEDVDTQEIDDHDNETLFLDSVIQGDHELLFLDSYLREAFDRIKVKTGQAEESTI